MHTSRPLPRRLLRPLLVAAVLSATLHAQAGNLGLLDQVDLIELEDKTSRALLVVLLEDDRVNSRQAMKLLFRKVNNYIDFVTSGQLRPAAPGMSTTLPPRIIVYGPRDATSAEMQNLAGLKLAGQKAGVDVDVRAHVPGIKARPVQILPNRRAA